MKHNQKKNHNLNLSEGETKIPSELKSMKLTQKDEKKSMESCVIENPKYPYGLTIRLENESIEKLGIGEIPESGKKMMVIAEVEVVGTNVRSMSNGKDHKSIELQITDMSLNDKEKKKEASDKLYGETN